LKYEEVNKVLLSEFPMFKVDDDDLELPYVTAGLFVTFILEAYQSKDFETYKKGLQFIEMLHTDDDHKVRELATVGYLESLMGSNIPSSDFGEETKKWWAELNRFWNGEINYIGETNTCK